jgi:hypothetical protein
MRFAHGGEIPQPRGGIRGVPAAPARTSNMDTRDD